MELPRRYRILVALDGTEYAQVVVEHALDQAARHDPVDLHVVTVVDDFERDCEATRAHLVQLVNEALIAFDSGKRDWITRVHVRGGEPEHEIPVLAADLEADLIVIGRYGMHHRTRSIADRVLDLSPCPLLVVGLTEHVIDPHPQCPDCVAIRARTDGDRWFCDAHTAAEHPHLSERLFRTAPSLTGGGPLL